MAKTTEKTPEVIDPKPDSVAIDTLDYPVLSAIDHNQKRFEAGDVLSIDAKTADPLLAVGAIGPATAEEPA